MAAARVMTVKIIIGSGSSMCAMIGEDVLKVLAKKLQKPNVDAAQPTGKRVGCAR